MGQDEPYILSMGQIVSLRTQERFRIGTGTGFGRLGSQVWVLDLGCGSDFRVWRVEGLAFSGFGIQILKNYELLG